MGKDKAKPLQFSERERERERGRERERERGREREREREVLQRNDARKRVQVTCVQQTMIAAGQDNRVLKK
jgi:hypothetical protein